MMTFMLTIVVLCFFLLENIILAFKRNDELHYR